MMADVERGISVLGHTPAPTSSSARWYRFDIDCAAHPAGVSVKALMREADGPRRKAKSSTSASATAVATNGTTGGPAAAATASSRTAMHDVAVGDPDANGTAAPDGGAEGPASSAPSFAKVGLAPAAPLGSRAGVSGLPILTNAAVAKKNSSEGGGDGAAASEMVTAHDADSSDADATIGSNADSAKAVAAAPADVSGSMDVESGPEPAAELQPKAGPQHQHRERASNWMSVIERLELEYGGGGAFVTEDASSGSRSDESDGDDAEDKESGGDGNGNEGLEGEGNGNGSGNGGEGNGGGKKKAKSKKKPVRKHSFDYEDDFIDDTELEKQYYAKEASSKVQTVHSGFFANQGTVATVEPDGGKENGGEAGADGSGVGEGDIVIRKKKKPKASSSNETGEGTKTSSGSSKKRKTPAESAAGPKKTPKMPDQQAVLADRFTGSVESSSSAQQRLGEGGSTTPSVNGVISTAQGATLGAASSAAAVTFSGDANGSGAAASVPQEGEGASSGNGGVTTSKNSDARNKDSSVTDAAGAGAAASAANGFEHVGTGGGGKGGSGEKNGKNGTKPPAPSWDLIVETAMTKFEEDSKAWVMGGRTAGEETDRVMEDMRALDVFARRTLADLHNSRTYLMRLAAVYGNTPLEMKTMLIELKEREDREECTRLQQEFNALRSVFVSEVAASVGQLAATGQPLTPPFSWSDNLRGHLHDMLKAFEAWSLKEHGGPRTRQALTETKALYDQLAQEWPAELSMTADCLRKMFNNEKRRIKAKANKEAAAEAGPAVATDTTAPPLPSSSAAATAVTSSSQNTPPANQSATANSVAPAANNGGSGGFVDRPAREHQSGLTMPPPALQRQQAPKTPVVPPRSSKETPTSSNSTATSPGTPFPAPSPGQQQVLPLAGGGREGGTLSFAEVSAATLTPALTPEYLPPLGSRFDLPPSFDPRNFQDDNDDDVVPVMLQ